MIAALSFLSANKNVCALVFSVLFGATLMAGSFIAGDRHRLRKIENENIQRNLSLAEMRGRDEAEIPAEDKRLEETAAGASQAVTQSCPVMAETARLIAAVR